MGLILDTNFIIVAEREAKRGITTTIDRFFATRSKESFYITFTVAGELACGHSASPKRYWDPYPILPWSNDISWQYGEALVHAMGVVTNNVDEFSRVPGLTVVSY